MNKRKRLKNAMMRIRDYLICTGVIISTSLWGQTNTNSLYETKFNVVLSPHHKTSISTDLKAKVNKIYAQFGQKFEKGDILIEFDSVVLHGKYENEIATVEKAQEKYNSKNTLYKENLVPLAEVTEAKAQLAKALSDLTIAKKAFEESKIYAPYSGKVVSVHIQEHEYPQEKKSLMDIVDDEKVIAHVTIPSKLCNCVSQEEPLYIHIYETGDTIIAYIQRIGAVIDPAKKTIKVEAEIDNADSKLKSGMTGVAYFKAPKPVVVENVESPIIKDNAFKNFALSWFQSLPKQNLE